ncbi:MAG: hypothetical protein K0Q87_1353 [Neobacillus sp.]|jgi:hypothetical protein|nr:hypothetical protein [Neobacillus sp.]
MMSKLNVQIEDILDSCEYDGENIRSSDDIDELYFKQMYAGIINRLQDLQRDIEYLSKPVLEQGFIRHNSAGRYELPSGRYFTSGSNCEILHDFYGDGDQNWIYTTIEHNGKDYYATSIGRDYNIDGCMVRIRR